jgi:hypothetical protein
MRSEDHSNVHLSLTDTRPHTAVVPNMCATLIKIVSNSLEHGTTISPNQIIIR